jgi:hypothetical protein
MRRFHSRVLLSCSDLVSHISNPEKSKCGDWTTGRRYLGKCPINRYELAPGRLFEVARRMRNPHNFRRALSQQQHCLPSYHHLLSHADATTTIHYCYWWRNDAVFFVVAAPATTTSLSEFARQSRVAGAAHAAQGESRATISGCVTVRMDVIRDNAM